MYCSAVGKRAESRTSRQIEGEHLSYDLIVNFRFLALGEILGNFNDHFAWVWSRRGTGRLRSEPQFGVEKLFTHYRIGLVHDARWMT